MKVDVEKPGLDCAGQILLSGGSGMLGSALAGELSRQGFRLLKLVRRQAIKADELQWDPAAANGGVALERLEGFSAAIHLSGANVAGRRWTAAYKREIETSRLQTTSALAELLARLRQPPRTLVSASAIGFYGSRGDAIVDEDSAQGAGFFPDLCAAWERSSDPAARAGIRVVHPRFGVVLGKRGGAMGRMRTLFQLGLGGNLGDGRQWMSWVSEPDTVAAVLFLLEHGDIAGPVNVTAPEPVTNAEFTRELARVLHRPAILPAPAFALRLVFGQMADEALLASTRAVPKRLLAAGFVFQHATLKSALAEVV